MYDYLSQWFTTLGCHTMPFGQLVLLVLAIWDVSGSLYSQDDSFNHGTLSYPVHA